jgi:DnaK suppressor protein
MTINLSEMRERLIAMLDENHSQIADLTSDQIDTLASDLQHDESDTSDPADKADTLYTAEVNREEVSNLRQISTLIEQAIARIDNGTYGRCLDCGKPIDEQRLEALPYAQYCLEDQEKHDARDLA